MKTIYKTTFTLIVLSEQPLPLGVSLSDIQYETDDGEWLLQALEGNKTELSGTEAVEAIKQAGSEPGFFNMDQEGNEIEEEF